MLGPTYPFGRNRHLVRAGCGLMLAAGGAQALVTGLLQLEQFAAIPFWAWKWAVGWTVLVAAFVAAEWIAASPRVHPALLAVQAVAALYLIWLYPSFLVTSMIVVVAWQIAWAASLRHALLAAGALSAALVAQKCLDQSGGMSIVVLLSACGFQLFALSAAHLAKSEAAARAELARTNAELTAAQALLGESARMAERLRISRDLHDVLGHSLATMTLHLDVAHRVTERRARTHVQHARDAAAALLDEVRQVVARMRVPPRDLRAALLALTDGLSGLEVRLELPGDLSAIDPARADAILRCVQELITNTLRHAQARELVVELTQAPSGTLCLTAIDDGRGGPIVEGRGLAGMRERFEALGGGVSIFADPGRGLRVVGAIPPAGAMA